MSVAKEMKSENKMGTDRAWAYPCLADYSDAPEVKRLTRALRFKNSEGETALGNSMLESGPSCS